MVALDQWLSKFHIILETVHTANFLVSPSDTLMHDVCDSLRNMHLEYTSEVIFGSLMLESRYFKYLASSQCFVPNSGGK